MDTSLKEQAILNRSYDDTTQSLKSTPSPMATKVTTVGSVTYVAKALPGTAQATAAWQAKKIDETTGVVITYADGDTLYNNVATNLELLNYS